MLMENILGTFIPIPDTMRVVPLERRKIYIKPVAYPGRGNLLFVNENGWYDFVNLRWEM